MQRPISRRRVGPGWAAPWRPLRRLGGQQEGQAVVETMFAVTVLVLLLVVMAQLFFISDLASYVMAAVHYQSTTDIHKLDEKKRFAYQVIAVEKSMEALPGVEMALGHFQQGGTPGQYTVKRRLAVFGGAYTGQGENAFYWVPGAFADSLVYGLGSGRRTLDLGVAIAQPIQ
ncbi:MAG: hypothetical protein HY910_02030 [Desulfarculus sp.]|nr:hypothetical protein [Desulfarculus sp.]